MLSPESPTAAQEGFGRFREYLEGDTEWEAWKAKAVRVCWTEPWRGGSPRSVLCMRGSIVPEARKGPPRGSKGVMPRTQARCEKWGAHSDSQAGIYRVSA